MPQTTCNLLVGYICGVRYFTGLLPLLIVGPHFSHLRSIIYQFTNFTNLVISQGCNFLKYVTRFSCDTFGFFVSWVYLQYGIQVITRQLGSSSSSATGEEGAYVQIILALVMLVTSYLFQLFGRKSTLFHRHVRRFFDDYGMPISLVCVSFHLSLPPLPPLSILFTSSRVYTYTLHLSSIERQRV